MSRRKSKKVVITDVNWSASTIRIKCREVIWGIVNKISESDILGFDQLDSCPISFGQHHKNKRRRKNNELKHVIGLKMPDYESGLVEENVYKVLDKGSVRFIKIIGVSSNSPVGNHSVAIDLENHEKLCLKRECLIPISKDEVSNVTQYIGDFEWKSDCFDKPIDIIEKYWDQRYRLFKLFDHGIKLDSESFFSVTPEDIADHITNKFSPRYLSMATIIDLFCGCGGNTISFAKKSKLVVSVDIDELKIKYLRKNSTIYNVNEKIDCVTCDVYDFLMLNIHPSKIRRIKERINLLDNPNSNDDDERAERNVDQDQVETSGVVYSNKKIVDILVMSPPWGGPEYHSSRKGSHKIYDLRSSLPCGDGLFLAALAACVADNIIYILPKNSSDAQISTIANFISMPYHIEDIYLNDKCKLKVVYFGLISSKKQKKMVSQNH